MAKVVNEESVWLAHSQAASDFLNSDLCVFFFLSCHSGCLDNVQHDRFLALIRERFSINGR